MMGALTSVPFPTYPRGFPPEVVEEFARIAGKMPLGNKTASGTEIIEELGAAHMESGRPILYTSADSVFQIAAHEEIVPLPTLYVGARKRGRCSALPTTSTGSLPARSSENRGLSGGRRIDGTMQSSRRRICSTSSARV